MNWYRSITAANTDQPDYWLMPDGRLENAGDMKHAETAQRLGYAAPMGMDDYAHATAYRAGLIRICSPRGPMQRCLWIESEQPPRPAQLKALEQLIWKNYQLFGSEAEYTIFRGNNNLYSGNDPKQAIMNVI